MAHFLFFNRGDNFFRWKIILTCGDFLQVGPATDTLVCYLSVYFFDKNFNNNYGHLEIKAVPKKLIICFYKLHLSTYFLYP
jgi:hypothetical protein